MKSAVKLVEKLSILGGGIRFGIPEKSKAVFINMDGTLLEQIPSKANLECISFMPGVEDALSLLADAGYKLIVMSNQTQNESRSLPAIAIEERLKSMFSNTHLEMDGFYYCPHSREASESGDKLDCICRKPQHPGLFFRAAKESDINLKQSWMLGSFLQDIEAGNRAGVRSIFVDIGNEIQWQVSPVRIPFLRVENFFEAAYWILRTDVLNK